MHILVWIRLCTVIVFIVSSKIPNIYLEQLSFLFIQENVNNRMNYVGPTIKLIDYKWLNTLSIPESFNANISHQLFDYTITFVNSQG